MSSVYDNFTVESSEIYDSDFKRTGCVPESKWRERRYNEDIKAV